MSKTDYFTALAPGHSPQDAWARLHRDIQRGERRDPLAPAIAARNGDLREFAYPAGVYRPGGRGTSCFARWVLDTGVDLQPDPEDDETNLSDIDLAALVRQHPRLLTTALAISQQIKSPASPTGYIEFPEPNGEGDAGPQFAEAERCHEVFGERQKRFYLFFGWVPVNGDGYQARQDWGI